MADGPTPAAVAANDWVSVDPGDWQDASKPLPPAKKLMLPPTVSIPLYNRDGRIGKPKGLDRDLTPWEKLAMSPFIAATDAAQQTGNGIDQIAHPKTLDDIAAGLSNTARGAGKLALPFVAPEAAAAPMQSLKAIIGGMIGGWGSERVAQAAGATPGVQDLAGTIGGAASGYGASRLPSLTLPEGLASTDARSLAKFAASPTHATKTKLIDLIFDRIMGRNTEPTPYQRAMGSFGNGTTQTTPTQGPPAAPPVAQPAPTATQPPPATPKPQPPPVGSYMNRTELAPVIRQLKAGIKTNGVDPSVLNTDFVHNAIGQLNRQIGPKDAQWVLDQLK